MMHISLSLCVIYNMLDAAESFACSPELAFRYYSQRSEAQLESGCRRRGRPRSSFTARAYVNSLHLIGARQAGSELSQSVCVCVWYH